MFPAFAACVLVWIYIRQKSRNHIYELVVFGAAFVYLCIVPTALISPFQIVVNSDEVYRAFSSLTYPFTMEQYRNYDANLFYYLIRLGSHDGPVFIQFPATQYQGEFIHSQHHFSVAVLGLLTMLGPMLVVILSYVMDRFSSPLSYESTTRIIFPLFIVQVLIIIVMIVSYFIGALIYLATGFGALTLTLHPFIRALRNADNK